jgi:DNA (cytosine-5)-methyltransferase 1
MSGKPLLLDLFCGAGGAGMGYHRAGFDVLGVDINPQPHYPFRFEQADALDYLREEIRFKHYYSHVREVVAVHASPPCQAHTTMSNKHRGKGSLADRRVDLIGPTRELLLELGVPYIIENVTGAKRALWNPILLHGGQFGLGVHRPRYFESNVALVAPPRSLPALNPIGVYGKHHDGRRLFTRADGSIQRAAKSLDEGRAAMGIDWMEWRELAESLPPSFTEYLGRQLLQHLASERAA